jgi:hypothetical protein
MKKRPARDWFFLLFPYAVYLVVTIIVFSLSPFTLHSDGISMINVAQKYHAGHFMDAVNSLWPPLFSMILAIIMYLPVHQVIAFKILQMILAFGGLILLDLIARAWIRNSWVRLFVLTAAGLFLSAYALRDATADMIACVATLLYTYFVTRDNFWLNKWDGVVVGVIWVLGYLARAYLLPFVAVSLAFIFIYKWFLLRNSIQRKVLLRNAVITIVVFVIVSSPWILALHTKFHTWTTGISGSLNYNKYSHEAVGAPLQAMFSNEHLIPPTAPTDQSMITELYPNQPIAWSPFQSKQAVNYQLLKIWKNIKILYHGIPSVANGAAIFAMFSPLLAGSFFAFGVYILSRPRWYEETKNILLFSVMAIYPLGYIIIEVNDRYFYVCAVLGLLFGGYLLEQLLPANKKWLLIASVAFLATTYVPFTTFKDLIAGYSFYYNRYSDGMYIRAHLPIENKRAAALGDDESVAFRAIYYAGIPFYWQLDPSVATTTVASELCKYHIDYPFINNSSGNPAVAARYAYLKKYYSGELKLQKYPELSVLYNAHLPCWTAPQVMAK